MTLQCSGTRRIEQIQEYPGDGDELINAPWGEGAMCAFWPIDDNESDQDCFIFGSGTSAYGGVPRKKVLKKACGGVLPECQHVEFIGADTYFK